MKIRVLFLVCIFITTITLNTVGADRYGVSPFFAISSYEEYSKVKEELAGKLEHMYFMWGRITRDTQGKIVFTSQYGKSISQFDTGNTAFGFPGDAGLVDFKARNPQGKAFISVFFSTSSDGRDALDFLHMTGDEWKERIIQPLLDFAVKYKFDGILLDFECFRDQYNNPGYTPEKQKNLKARYNSFIQYLRELSTGLQLGVCIHPTNVAGYYDGYDLNAINTWCDFIILMAYGYEYEDVKGNLHIFGTQPYGKVKDAVEKIIKKDTAGTGIDPEKLVLGMDLGVVKWVKLKKKIDENHYSYYYKKVNTKYYLSAVEALQGRIEYDANSRTQRKIVDGSNALKDDKLKYETGDIQIEQVEYYYETQETFDKKYLDLVKGYNLSGVSVWRLGTGSETAWKNLLEVFGNPVQAGVTPTPVPVPSSTPDAAVSPTPTPTPKGSPASTPRPTVKPAATPAPSKDASLTSTKYKVDQGKLTVSIGRAALPLTTFKAGIKAAKGATVQITKADGKTPVNGGNVVPGMKVKVLAGDRKTFKVYTIIR